MEIKVKDLKLMLDKVNEEEILNLQIGSGKRTYPVADIMKSPLSGKVVFCTQGYADWKRKNQLVIG